MYGSRKHSARPIFLRKSSINANVDGKAIPDTEILVLNEHGQLCKPGEPGELVHRGPTVSLGYWNRPEETARALRPKSASSTEMGDCEKVCYSATCKMMKMVFSISSGAATL